MVGLLPRSRQRVGFTVLAGLLLLGLFAVGQSGLAILGIVRFQSNFDEIAKDKLSSLVAASHLSELSQSIVASVPSFAAATTQITREAVADQLTQELADLQRSLRALEGATDKAQVAAMRRVLSELVASLQGLDGLVRQRIDADLAYETVLTRLPPLVGRIREASGPGAGTPAGDVALTQWSSNALDATSLMLATPATRNTSRLVRIQAEVAPLIDAMIAARETLPAPAQLRIQRVHDDVVRFGHSSENIFDARRLQLEMEPAIQLALKINRQTGDAFVASVAQIFAAIQNDVTERAVVLDHSVSTTVFQLVAIALLSAAAGTLIFLYVRRSVIQRLRALQDSMTARVEGRPAPIPAAGDDEIAAMANATAFFVDTIERREESLKRTFEATPVALALVRLPDGAVVRTNQRADDLFGAIPPGGAAALFEDAQAYARLIDQLTRETFVDDVELRMRGDRNEYFWGLV
ncbi:MAG: hypothetical protein JO021_08690, partial [Alphaproteobacteria bacterium]|nr:hypothetical protein [Alphaproteobacteria bacterium]